MTSSPPLVLVADDEPSMLELVARHLRTMNHPKLEVIQASDGEEAWRLAQEHLPDLVVLDVMMPGMSGWEVCRKIREDIALAHTGVLMLTGIGENLNQMTSPLYGADAFIDKPFEFDDFDEKVRSTLRGREAQRLAVVRPTINGTAGAAKPALLADKGTKRSSKKKASTKRAGAKKAVTKTAGAKTAGAKTAGAKKAGAKKAGAKKAGAKKAGAKKAIATKPSKAASKKKSAAKRVGAAASRANGAANGTLAKKVGKKKKSAGKSTSKSTARR
jgi:DNA-binding response OmpR family regulator